MANERFRVQKCQACNVKTYFYRLDFQKRGTAHLHLLIWLQDITKIKHQFIRADIPNDHPDFSYLACEDLTNHPTF